MNRPKADVSYLFIKRCSEMSETIQHSELGNTIHTNAQENK